MENRERGVGDECDECCARESKKISFNHLSVWPKEATEDICFSSASLAKFLGWLSYLKNNVRCPRMRRQWNMA